jgi:hypothetical protein
MVLYVCQCMLDNLICFVHKFSSVFIVSSCSPHEPVQFQSSILEFTESFICSVWLLKMILWQSV